MRKFLSLLLALIMTMSLVTLSAGATDFTDDSDISYNEAIDVISAIGVVDGYSDGSFKPTAVLTRGAAAKIICNMILGPAAASNMTASAAPFKDVPANHTFAAQIAYCAQQGIINGYADGTFKPGDSVNWGAALKMVLAYAGYEDAAPVEGGTWASGYIALAKSEGLIDGDVEQNANITRVEMCQLLAKALKIEASEKESAFPDTDDGYVLALAELGVIGGNPDGTFNPDGELTRAQLCKILAEAPEAPAAEAPAESEEPAAAEAPAEDAKAA